MMEESQIEGMDTPETNPQEDQQAILDRFLALAPTLGPIRLSDNLSVEAENSHSDEATETATGIALDPETAERMARALLAQGKRKEAAAILVKLSVQMPEKSVYFADLLDNRAAGAQIF